MMGGSGWGGAREAGAVRRGRMSQETLDLRRSMQLVRRHKVVVAAFAALGLLAGAGLVLHRPPMLSSEALVNVVLPPTEQAAAPAQAGGTSNNPTLPTQNASASSTSHLQNALR